MTSQNALRPLLGISKPRREPMDHLNLVGGAYTDSTKYQGLLCTALPEESMACVTYPHFVSCDASHVFGLFASLMSRCGCWPETWRRARKSPAGGVLVFLL